jgi:hypothetical protein
MTPVRLPAVENFSLLLSVKTDSGTHSASCTMATEGTSPGVKRQRHEARIFSADVKNGEAIHGVYNETP